MSTSRGSWDGSSYDDVPQRKGVSFADAQRDSTSEVPRSSNPPPRPPRQKNGINSDAGNSLYDGDALYDMPPKTHRSVVHDPSSSPETGISDPGDGPCAAPHKVYRPIAKPSFSYQPGSAWDDDDTASSSLYTPPVKTAAKGSNSDGAMREENNNTVHAFDDVDGSLHGARAWDSSIPEHIQRSHNYDDIEYSLQDAREWEYAVPHKNNSPLDKQSQPKLKTPKPTQEVSLRADKGRCRLSAKSASPLIMRHYCNVTEDQVKVILELKSPDEGPASSDRAPLRLVCLFDISGSMLQKCGSKRTDGKHRETKLIKMRNVAKILTKTLEDQDYLGIMTFGSEADVIFPLTRLDSQAKKDAFSTVKKLGKYGLSMKTNLSKGLLSAINMFRSSSRETGSKSLKTQDAIVVMTDGEINEGITDGQALVREIRQAIRDFEMESRHYSKDPSLTISTVVTGSDVSEVVYLLSKTCGNDAYYYIDKETDAPEVAALMPVLLRKTSVASSISIKAEALDPAELLPKLCSHEYMAHRPHDRDDEINYFIHDLGWGMSKHLSIILDKDSVFCEDAPKAVVLRVNVEYKDRLLNRRSLVHTVSRREVEGNVPAAIQQFCLQDVRRISQIAFRSVADLLIADDTEKAVAQLHQCKTDVRKELQKYAKMTVGKSETAKMTEFVESVVTNLANLLAVIDDNNQTTGQKWSTVKAVSSAIVRETPSVPDLVAQEETICNTKSVAVELSELRKFIKQHYKTLGVESLVLSDFDNTMTELHNTLPRCEPEAAHPGTGTGRSRGDSSDDKDYTYSTHV